MASRVTIVDLANQLGVSRQTISNVLNAPHRVKEETRIRVARAIEESGYRPNAAARQLRNHVSKNVGMRLQPAGNGISGTVLTGFLYGLTEAAHSHGYRVTLYCADSDEEEISRYEELVTEADLDGFILTATHHGDQRAAWLAQRGIPFVAFGRPWDSGRDVSDAGHSWVDVDGRSGTREATEHLIAAGHRRIGYIGWPNGSGVGGDRRSGWLEAMTEHFGTEDPAPLIYAGEDTAASGSSGAATLLARGATAFVCASDSLALGASAYLRQSDQPALASAVVGFDNTPVAAAVGLSSVSQPVESAAAEVMRLLLGHLNSPTAEPQHVLLRPRLELRDLQPFNH
ncbi:LacI family transcriptional regulator [Pseudarthrobacter phenanthrenivorans]|uniref:LacI family transcriptional regulator n=2 Tax=Pseudarthrobacter phenanthrenivorans TaxID=361575 RepID=A0A3B0G0D6_PSEPS|nr:LacI family DNA-binding transcriptional regulator [Pseudarthrobacter phenanthrenivorans]ADX74078.1 transcriptional regulator [Pseudarthrobacter phenanthrenivorans Sphe3]RKO25398.1 LacI family transcriptional regulator [Pseudarthrobacter phenanthrenivorans]